jgi:DNA-binding HxlR family transcriptional regulator
MIKQTRGDVFKKSCPSRALISWLADKWTVLIIIALIDEAKHFGRLRREVEGISQKSLTQTLRSLERNGIVSRTVLPTRPPRVEYAMTKLGMTLLDWMENIRLWSEKHMKEVVTAQAKFDAVNR